MNAHRNLPPGPWALAFVPVPLTQCTWGDTAPWFPVQERQLWPTTAASGVFWPDFSPLFISKAKSTSLFLSLLPFWSVTGYKWKQQGHSRLYFQSSLKVIQTQRLNSPHGCPSMAGRIKLPFVLTNSCSRARQPPSTAHLWPQQSHKEEMALLSPAVPRRASKARAPSHRTTCGAPSLHVISRTPVVPAVCKGVLALLPASLPALLLKHGRRKKKST